MGSKMYYSISLIVVTFSLLAMMTGPLTVQAADSGSNSGSGDGGGKSSDGGSNSNSGSDKGSSDNNNNNNNNNNPPDTDKDKGTPSNPDPDKDKDNDVPGGGGDTDHPNNPPGPPSGPPGNPGPPGFIGQPGLPGIIPPHITPSHPCPKSNPFCHTPQPAPCPRGYHHNGRICERDIVINVHTHYTGGSSGSGSNGHYLSDTCYTTIKTAWLGKVTRGDNSEVDNTIDNCMGIH
jgi:hypothetical protein